jgi:hypothetical protein
VGNQAGEGRVAGTKQSRHRFREWQAPQVLHVRRSTEKRGTLTITVDKTKNPYMKDTVTLIDLIELMDLSREFCIAEIKSPKEKSSRRNAALKAHKNVLNKIKNHERNQI